MATNDFSWFRDSVALRGYPYITELKLASQYSLSNRQTTEISALIVSETIMV